MLNMRLRALRRFAFADGRFTEDSIREYLVMLSVAETCGYQSIDVLKSSFWTVRPLAVVCEPCPVGTPWCIECRLMGRDNENRSRYVWL
jgi:hypothetical protein